MEKSLRHSTENLFRDEPVSEIVKMVQNQSTSEDREEGGDKTTTDTTRDSESDNFIVSHGSRIESAQQKCALCHGKTQRRCLIAPSVPHYVRQQRKAVTLPGILLQTRLCVINTLHKILWLSVRDLPMEDLLAERIERSSKESKGRLHHSCTNTNKHWISLCIYIPDVFYCFL